MAKKKIQNSPVVNMSQNVQDVEHEEVKQNGHPAIIPQVLSEEQVISNEIQKFKVSDQRLQELQDQYGGLEIAGPDDKEGYKKVKEAWGVVRSTRTGLEKTGLELRRRFNAITKGIIKEEDRLSGPVGRLEADLYCKWKAIDDAKELEKAEKARAEQEILLARVNELIAAGMQQQDEFYQIGGTIAVDVATLRAFDAKRYNELLTAVRAKKSELDAAAEKAAEEQRQLQEKADRLKLETEEQEKRLAKLKADAAALVRKSRIAELEGLGLTFDSVKETFYHGFNVAPYGWTFAIDAYSDEDFKAVVSNISNELATIKKAAADREEKQKHVWQVMHEAGTVYDYTVKGFVFKNDVLNYAISLQQLMQWDIADIEKTAAGIGKEIAEAKQKAEQARQAALSDEVNMAEYISLLLQVRQPLVTTSPANTDLHYIFTELENLHKKYEQK